MLTLWCRLNKRNPFVHNPPDPADEVVPLEHRILLSLNNLLRHRYTTHLPAHHQQTHVSTSSCKIPEQEKVVEELPEVEKEVLVLLLLQNLLAIQMRQKDLRILSSDSVNRRGTMFVLCMDRTRTLI